MSSNFYSSITPEVQKLTNLCIENGQIDPSLYAKYDGKRGRRDISGKGGLAGLTEIADVKAYNMVDGKMIPWKGELYYRGYNVEDSVRGLSPDQTFGFEDITYRINFDTL